MNRQSEEGIHRECTPRAEQSASMGFSRSIVIEQSSQERNCVVRIGGERKAPSSARCKRRDYVVVAVGKAIESGGKLGVELACDVVRLEPIEYCRRASDKNTDLSFARCVTLGVDDREVHAKLAVARSWDRCSGE